MVTVRRAAQVAGVVAVSTIMTVVALGLVEGGLRAVWALRNFRLEAVALPYVVDDYGPVPPWADAARVLEPDPALLWRSRAGVEATRGRSAPMSIRTRPIPSASRNSCVARIPRPTWKC